MSDWRSGEPNQHKSKKPSPAIDFPQVSSKPTGGWKGKGKQAKNSSAENLPVSRTWLGDTAEVAPLSSSVFRKWLVVSTLLLLIVFLLSYFLITVYFKAPKLPLFVFGVEGYDSRELMENPYADSQRKKYIAANSGNVETHKVLNDSGDDNALSSLENDEWINGFKTKRMSGKLLKPGGPDRKIVAFYINAYASFTSQNDLVIYSQQSNPFATDGDQGLKLEDALKNIAAKVPKDSLAWVILDLQLPLGVANLDNLDPPWQTAGEQALSKLSKLEPQLEQRLLLTLPGKDGQQNWLAPEFQGSFFGHYVLQLIEGRFAESTLLDSEISVGEFQKLLENEVSNRVSNRRFAEQNPVWIPEATFTKFAAKGLVTIPNKQSVSSSEPTVVDDQLIVINSLWKTVTADKYQAGYRWDPMGYAKVESQLIALEEIAINCPDSFLAAKKLVDESWNAMLKPADGFGVSLIEDRQRDLYFHQTASKSSYKDTDELAQKLINSLKDSANAVPSFLNPPVAPGAAETPQPPESIAPESIVPESQRPFLLWQFYAEASKGENRSIWESIFSLKKLNNALSYVGSDANWLEIYLLRRMASDIDWSLPNPDRVKACADALHNFQRIQTLATTPEPELSWWVRQDLEPIEEQSLRCFDQVLANQASEAIKGFDKVSEALNQLEPKAKKLNSAINQANEVLHAIPHMLAWLAAEYQFVEEEDLGKIESQVEELGKMAGLANLVYKILGRETQIRLDTVDESFFLAASDLQQAFTKQTVAFKSYIDAKTNLAATGAASNSPQTFRRERIVLHTPFLSLEERQKFHDNTSAFLKSKVAEIREQKSGQKITQQRRGIRAVQIFLDAEADKNWQAIAKGDPRFVGLKPFDEAPQPSGEDRLTVRSELLATEFWQRCYAHAYGAHPTLHTEPNRGTSWPWSCARQRWSLADANYCLWQVSRLSEASWGEDNLEQMTSSDKFYFYRLSEKYRLQNQIDDAPSIAKLTQNIQTEMSSVRNANIQRLKSLQLRLGYAGYPLAQSGGTLPIKVACSVEWNCVAQVFLRGKQERTPWQMEKGDKRTLAVDLLERDKQNNQPLDADRWPSSDRPIGTLLIRGNRLSTQAQWLTGENKQIELTMARTFNEDSSICILPPKEKPPITVLMLIDCSNSMEMTVPRLKEGNETEYVKLHGLVKANANRLIEQFGEIHRREALVKFGLLPFGLRQEHLEEQLGELKGLLKMQPGDFYLTKDISPLNQTWQAKMEQLVDKLKPSGDTPLYNAIALACEMAQPTETTLIYVLSDGVNYLNKEGASKNVSDVHRLVSGNKQLRLSIFHYDFFKLWLSKQDASEHAFWQKQYDIGIAELKGLEAKLSKEQYGYYNSDEAAKLMQDSMNTIPSMRVTVQSKGTSADKQFKAISQPLGSEIKIDRTFLPANFQVFVRGLKGEIDATFELFGGEKLELEYEEASRIRLAFEKGIDSGWEKLKGAPEGGSLGSHAFLKTLRDRLPDSDQLGFELNFMNNKDNAFTPRPRFIVAELSQTNAPQGNTFVLADHCFMSQNHWPIVRLSEVSWPAERPLATLRVWASDTPPTNHVRIEKVEPQGVGDIQVGVAKVHFSHDGKAVIAKVKYDHPPKASDRVVVICPSFESAHRKFYSQDASEEHAFTLPESLHNKASTLQFTTIAELEKAVQANQVTSFNFDAIDLK